MELLSERIQYHDPDCIKFFRDGAPIFGFLDASGNGNPKPVEMKGDCKALCGDRANANSGLLASLKEDPHSDVLLEKVLEDARLGRMSFPMKVGDVNLADIVLSPRFAVEQGASVCLCLASVHACKL